MTTVARLLLGLALASGVAFGAWRRKLLTGRAALAAIVCGSVVTAAGWSMSVALLAFFGSSAALSRWRRAHKDAATGGIVDKSGARDAWQVVANGGVMACCAAAAWLAPSPAWTVAGLGAIAAATADTWATEIGSAVGDGAWRLWSFVRVPAGTSGAVTTLGTVALLLGAAAQGTVAVAWGFDLWTGAAIAVGGATGGLVDTILGATIQERRWCSACRESTEQHVHRCGAPTTAAGGLAFMSNDTVNLTSTLAGALAATVMHLTHAG